MSEPKKSETPVAAATTRSEHDVAWEKNFVVPIGREMKKRGIAYMVMILRDDGKLAYVLEPNTPDDATVDALIRQPDAGVDASATEKPMTPNTPHTVGHVGWSPDYKSSPMPSVIGKLMPVVQRRLVLRGDFERGYFCAVAVMLKENYSEGVAGSDVQSLFRQGGDWRKADPEDIETFRRHGLIPAENAIAVTPGANGMPLK